MTDLRDTQLDEDLAALLEESVAEAARRERSAFDEAAGPERERLVLYGAGGQGIRVAHALREHGLVPLAFVDRRPELWGATVDGVPVLPPEEAAGRLGAGATFVLTVWNEHFDYRQTEAELAGLGCRRIVPLPALVWKYADALLPHLFFDLPHGILGEAGNLRRAFELLSDSLSRKIFVSQLRLQLQGDPRDLPTTSDHVQYFPPELPPLDAGSVFVDVGAYDGDTLRDWLAVERGARYVGLEPDPANFGRLQERVAHLSAAIRGRITLLPVAASDRRQRLRFGGYGSSAGADPEGNIEVEAAPLEALDLPRPVTYLKVDVEGAEEEVLRGARQVVAQDQPALALAVYHHPADLWQLPLLVAELCPAHTFLLRRYAQCGFETVLYAIPPG